MTSKILSFDEASKNWPRILRSAAQGQAVRIVVEGKTVELHLVKSSTKSKAAAKYDVTPDELSRFEKRVHEEIQEDRKAGKLHEFTGDLQALLESKPERKVAKTTPKAAVKKNKADRRVNERRTRSVGKPTFA